MSIDVSAVTGCRVRSRRPTVTPTKPDFGVASLAFLHAALCSPPFIIQLEALLLQMLYQPPVTAYFSTRASRKVVNNREWIGRLGIYIFETIDDDLISTMWYHRDRTLYLKKII